MNGARRAVCLTGLGAAALGVMLLVLHVPVLPHLMIGPGLLVAIATWFERKPYKPATETLPGPGWIETDERFVDPTTGKFVTVYFNPGTGERQYVQRRAARN